MTLPGVSTTVAQTLLAALGDVTRFRDGAHAASYLGLVPRTHQSASRCYQGAITKQGHRQARSLLVQAAHHVTQHPGPLGAFFRRVVKRRGCVGRKRASPCGKDAHRTRRATSLLRWRPLRLLTGSP